MKKQKIKSVRTGAFSRSLSIAGLGFRAGMKAASFALGEVFSEETNQAIRKKALLLEQAALVAKELGKLKGSLMKAGQMFSVYGEHFLPPEANAMLKTLQQDSPPVEWPAIRKILLKELGKDKLAELEIEHDSIAAASLGQVHRAKIKATGEDIVLKIQYPNVHKAIDGDLKALRQILSLTEWLPKIPATENIFEEVRLMLHQELDYEKEIQFLTFFRETLSQETSFVLPKPFLRYCTKRIITMTYEPGVAVDSEEVAKLSQSRRNALAERALHLYFQELFVWRKVQTDPHFGNYRIRLNKMEDQWVLYDYGAIREVPLPFMSAYKQLLRGLFYKDRKTFEKGAIALRVMKSTDPQELKDLFFDLCGAIMEPFGEEQPFEWSKTDLPQRVAKMGWEIAKNFPLREPPRELVFLDRKMAGMFTLLSVLHAKIDARKVLEPFLAD